MIVTKEEAKKAVRDGKAIIKEIKESDNMTESDKKDKMGRVDQFFNEYDEYKSLQKAETCLQEAGKFLEQQEAVVRLHNYDTKGAANPNIERGSFIDKFDAFQSTEYKSALRNLIMGSLRKDDLTETKKTLGKMEYKALSSVVDPDGGYVVDEEMSQELIKKLDDPVTLLGRVRKINTNASSFIMPTFDYTPTVGAVSEAATIPTEDITDAFGKAVFSPVKFAKMFLIPSELRDDAFLDVQKLFIDQFSRIFGEQWESFIINGNGANQPLGLVSPGGTGIGSTSMAGTTPTVAELIDFRYAIKESYGRNGTFVTHRTQLAAIRKLETTAGQHLWEPVFQAGQPDRILGQPIIGSEFFPVTTTSGDPLLLFGDLSFYTWVQRSAFTVDVSDHHKFDTDQIAIRLKQRIDGSPVIAEAFHYLKAV